MSTGQTSEYEMGISEGDVYIWELVSKSDDYPDHDLGEKMKHLIQEVSITKGIVKIEYKRWRLTEKEFSEENGYLSISKTYLDPAKAATETKKNPTYHPTYYSYVPTPSSEWIESYLENENVSRISGGECMIKEEYSDGFIETTFNEKGVPRNFKFLFSDDSIRYELALTRQVNGSVPGFNPLLLILFFSIGMVLLIQKLRFKKA